MSKESLIGKLERRAALAEGEANQHKDDFQAGLAAGLREGVYEIRQHEADQPKDVVERVAIAICPWFNGSKDGDDPRGLWDDMFDRYKEAYREQAKAAIVAMSEITSELKVTPSEISDNKGPEINTEVLPGFWRTVWWCWLINEPMILEFDASYPKCSGCDWVDDCATDGIPSANFCSQHTLIGRLKKPSQEKVEEQLNGALSIVALKPEPVPSQDRTAALKSASENDSANGESIACDGSDRTVVRPEQPDGCNDAFSVFCEQTAMTPNDFAWRIWQAAWNARPMRESGEPSVGLSQILKDAFFEGFGIGDVMADEATIEGYWLYSQAKADIPSLLPTTDIEVPTTEQKER